MYVIKVICDIQKNVMNPVAEIKQHSVFTVSTSFSGSGLAGRTQDL